MTTKISLKDPFAARVVRVQDGQPAIRALYPILIAIAALSLIVHLIEMRTFDALGFFYLDDTLFNSDPASMRDVFSHGARSISIIYPEIRNSIHPYLWLYFGPLFRGIAKVATTLHLTDLSALDLRAELGLYVSPAVAAAQSIVLGMLLQTLGFSARHIILISLLNLAAFSNLIFGAIPEHFGLSSLAITLMFIVAAKSQDAPRLDDYRIWTPLGLFSAGITISNLAPLGICHFMTGAFRGGFRAKPTALRLLHGLAFTLTLGIFVLASAHAIGVAMDGPLPAGSVRDNFVPRYIRGDVTIKQAPERAFATLGNTVAPAWSDIRKIPATPLPSPYDPARPAPFERSPYPTYTLEPAPGTAPGMGVLGLISLAAMALGAIAMIRRGGAFRLAAVMALALLAFNVALHLAWGDEFFIYSQHWIAPQLVLMGGVLLAPPPLRLAADIAFAAFLVAVAWNNVDVVRHLVVDAEASAQSAQHAAAVGRAP